MVPDKVASSDNVEHHIYVISFFMERYKKRGKSSQDKSGQVRSDQKKSDKIRSDQVKSDKIRSGLFRIYIITKND